MEWLGTLDLESAHISRIIPVIKKVEWNGFIWLLAYAWWRHQVETFSAFLPFVSGIHRSPVNSPHKGQWSGALMFSSICAWINGWVNNRKASDLRRHRGPYDVMNYERYEWVMSRYTYGDFWESTNSTLGHWSQQNTHQMKRYRFRAHTRNSIAKRIHLYIHLNKHTALNSTQMCLSI